MTSAWYNEKIAPDGNVEDGCHPDEARALEEFLSGRLNTKDAAYHITRPVARSNRPYDSVQSLWALLRDALLELPRPMLELPLPSMSKVIGLLQAIQEMPETEANTKVADMWPHLNFFGSEWSDEMRKEEWRSHLHDWQIFHSDSWSLQHIRTAHVEALMVTHDIGRIPLIWGIQDICDALESSKAVLEIELPAMVEWFAIAGGQIYKSALLRETIRPTPLEHDLWKGDDVLSLQRWLFWQERVTAILIRTVDEVIRSAAQRILSHMKGCHQKAQQSDSV